MDFDGAEKIYMNRAAILCHIYIASIIFLLNAYINTVK